MSEKLKNAPLFFSIAQIRFNPILTLKEFVPTIQERMRKAAYTDFKQGLSMTFNLSLRGNPDQAQPSQPPVQQQIERFLFSNMENTRCFILQPQALSLQTTHYETFDLFSREFMNGLKIVNDVVGLDYSARIGIRCLDAVFPRKNEELAQYLIPEVLGVSKQLSGSKLRHSFSETLAGFPDGSQVVARTIIQDGPLGFPPDLELEGLELPNRFRDLNGRHAILDTDGAFAQREQFNEVKIMQRLTDLHKKISTGFFATVTDYARSAWN